MNFPTVPTVQEALIQRAEHPAFGYFSPSQEYYDSIIRCSRPEMGSPVLTSECIGYENGVLGGVVSALNVFCSKGDKVLLHSPTYIGFTGSLKNNGYDMVLSPLKRDEKGIWRMDLKIWRRNWLQKTSMPLFSVLPTIPADGCGNAGNWKKPWPFSRNMMSMWFLTRSGLT